jgi:hypothetical protein
MLMFSVCHWTPKSYGDDLCRGCFSCSVPVRPIEYLLHRPQLSLVGCLPWVQAIAPLSGDVDGLDRTLVEAPDDGVRAVLEVCELFSVWETKPNTLHSASMALTLLSSADTGSCRGRLCC